MERLLKRRLKTHPGDQTKTDKGERYFVKHKTIIATVALVISCSITVFAQTPEFNNLKPSTTGVPGEEVRVMKFDPAGNLWIAGRFYFWGEVGLAMLSSDQTNYEPLPGGGFDTGAWRVWSSVHHPIPSPYINDMEFGSGGVIWIASDGGLTRFDPAAPTEEQMWFTYTPANSPLILSEVRSLAFDSQGNLLANECKRTVLKRCVIPVQSHNQRVDTIPRGPGITVDAAMV